MAKNTIQKNPNTKDAEVVERLEKIKNSNIDMRDKRTAAGILIRSNSVSKTMQKKNRPNKTDIGHRYDIRKQLDDIFKNNKPIAEVISSSHYLQEEQPSSNRGKSVSIHSVTI